MGLDYMALMLCQLVRKQRGDLGEVLTIGRQQLNLTNRHLERLGIPSVNPLPRFCESLLENRFGASRVESLDVSGYEGATIISDLNIRTGDTVPWKGAFDVVFDSGTLEHVLDVKTAFDEVTDSVRLGGCVVHLLPANQECGHGFYQFSPEFFFSYFSHQRGFADVQVIAALASNPERLYRLNPPNQGRRLRLESAQPLYIACIATRRTIPRDSPVQQSDYVYIWGSGTDRNAMGHEEQVEFERGSRLKDKFDSLTRPLAHGTRTLRRIRKSVLLAGKPVKANDKFIRIDVPRR